MSIAQRPPNFLAAHTRHTKRYSAASIIAARDALEIISLLDLCRLGHTRRRRRRRSALPVAAAESTAWRAFLLGRRDGARVFMTAARGDFSSSLATDVLRRARANTGQEAEMP